MWNTLKHDLKLIGWVTLTALGFIFYVGAFSWALKLVSSSSDVGVATGVLILGFLVTLLILLIVEGVRYAKSKVEKFLD